MEFEAIMELVAEEIICAGILPDDCKDDVIRQISLEVQHPSSQSWFNCRMFLWKNRSSNISKYHFFEWLGSTHLRELLDLQGGMFE